MRQTILRLKRELGLTILLSSHMLSEVEQLCTRIAVLSKGRLVFEGDLASTRSRSHWVRLKTDDFPQVIARLREAGLIADSREPNLIALRDGVGTDRVVRFLVERGMPVFEIAPEEETLEAFYLSLMTGEREAANSTQNVSTCAPILT